MTEFAETLGTQRAEEIRVGSLESGGLKQKKPLTISLTHAKTVLYLVFLIRKPVPGGVPPASLLWWAPRLCPSS